MCCFLYISGSEKKSTEGCQADQRCHMIPYPLGLWRKEGGTDDQVVAMRSISTGRILPRLFRPNRYCHLSPDRDGT